MIDRVCSLIRMQKPSIDDGALLYASGKTVPSDATRGYRTGCIFHHTDGGAKTALYVNEGSASSCAFRAVQAASTSELDDLSDVDTLAYTGGSILVADNTSKYVERAVSGHATLDATGALTLATVTKTNTVALTDLRQEDAGKDLLPDAPDGDGGTLGLADAIGSPVVGTTTNNTAVTEKCAFDFVVPPDYVAESDLTVRVNALVSAARNAESLLDVVVKHIKAGALDATDLVLTDAVDMKDVTTAANQDFTVDGDASGDEINPGDVLHVEISFETDDTGGSSNGYAQINAVQVLVPSYR